MKLKFWSLTVLAVSVVTKEISRNKRHYLYHVSFRCIFRDPSSEGILEPIFQNRHHVIISVGPLTLTELFEAELM